MKDWTVVYFEDLEDYGSSGGSYGVHFVEAKSIDSLMETLAGEIAYRYTNGGNMMIIKGKLDYKDATMTHEWNIEKKKMEWKASLDEA